MTKKSNTPGLGPDELHNLLKVCSEKLPDSAQEDSNQQKAELLQDILSEPLTMEACTTGLTEELTSLCTVSGLLSGETIGNLLKNPKTNISIVKKIKDINKEASSSSKTKVQHDIANAIYYATIAHALVYHGKRITEFTYDELEQSFSAFSKIKWISSDLSELYKKAGCLCRDRRSTHDK